MEVQQVLNYMSDYGLVFLAVIIFLEYLNLPGFPAGIILPVAGLWASRSHISFFLALLVSVASALIASWMLYWLGRFGGEFMLNKYVAKFPKQKQTIQDKVEYLRKKGCIGVFISKLIPMVRTIISIPAGVVKLNFWNYTVSSALGITIWNGVLIASGYFFGTDILALVA
ncbi:MAG: DedA family protein [Cellulosilyticaceae bacterium]